MPSLTQPIDSVVSPAGPVEPNGAPLSIRIWPGRPGAWNSASQAAATVCVRGDMIRHSSSIRLAVSVTVSGSQRVPQPVRNPPLKSIAHSSFGKAAAANGASCGSLRRWRWRGAVTRPDRRSRSPTVEAAGQATSGRSRASTASSLRGPQCGRASRRASKAAAISGAIACGRPSGAREASSSPDTPLSRQRFSHLCPVSRLIP